MIHVIASVTVRADRRPEFVAIFKANVPRVLREKGCIEYRPAVDLPAGVATQSCDPRVVTILERWESLEDLRRHLSAPHMLAYREQVKEIVESVTLKILEEI